MSRFIPAFERTTVATQAGGGRTTVAARRAITIRDLLTHTAGFVRHRQCRRPLDTAKGLGRPPATVGTRRTRASRICQTIEWLATLPVVAQPGERFVYGYNTESAQSRRVCANIRTTSGSGSSWREEPAPAPPRRGDAGQ